MTTHPNDEKPYSEEEVARARALIPEDEIGEATNFCYGTQVVYVENVVLLLCAALRTASTPDNAWRFHPSRYNYDSLRERLRACVGDDNALADVMCMTLDIERAATGGLLDSIGKVQPATPASASEAEPVAVIGVDGYPHWLASFLRGTTWAKLEPGTKLYTHPTLHQPPSGDWVMVPVNPTEEQWGGLARDIVMWMQAYHPHTGADLFKHLERSGRDIPKWLYEEVENTDFAPPKGTIAAIIYRAMIAAAPPADGNPN